MRKYLLLLALLIFTLPLMAESVDNGGHAGTPAGFYDDIDPNSLDDEDKDIQQTNNKSNKGAPVFTQDGTFHEYSDDDEIMIAPTEQAKATKNYAQIYNNLEPASHSYLHGIDPDEFYDVKDATGYYLLTPREHDGKWYILFKQNGKVVYIIPVYERGYTPQRFYDEHIPKPKLKPSQKAHMKILSVVGKVKSSKRQEPVKSFLEVNDLDNYFINIIIYYGGHKYSTIFRTVRL